MAVIAAPSPPTDIWMLDTALAPLYNLHQFSHLLSISTEMYNICDISPLTLPVCCAKRCPGVESGVWSGKCPALVLTILPPVLKSS